LPAAKRIEMAQTFSLCLGGIYGKFFRSILAGARLKVCAHFLFETLSGSARPLCQPIEP